VSTKLKKYNSGLEILFFVLLGLAPRLLLLIHSNAGIESDEAIVGLMAKHITEGTGIPAFYYGQAYMGSLESIIAALYFFIFGVNNWALKSVPLTFSLILIALSYLVALEMRGRTSARIAALCTAIAPSSLIIWSLKARGGFIETLVIGSLALLLTIKICKNKSTDMKNDAPLWWGIAFSLGLGWWTNNQIIFYIAPIGIILLFKLFYYQNPVAISKYVLSSLFLFFLGSLPFWTYNILHKPRWASFDVLFGSTAGNFAGQYFHDFWTTALPIILGAQKFWSEAVMFPGAQRLSYIIYAVAFIACFPQPKIISKNKTVRSNVCLETLLLFLFLAFVPTIFSLSSFGWLSQAPRYLLPLYSVLPVCLGIGISNYLKSSFIPSKILGTIILLGVLTINLSSNYLYGIADEGQPMVFQSGRVAKDQRELYDWLKKEGHTHIYTNYWIGYRTAFETKEKITFSRFGRPKSLRIPSYEESHQAGEILGKVFVLVPQEAKEFELWLQRIGFNYRKTTLKNSYIVLDQIRYKYPEGELLRVEESNIAIFIPPHNIDNPQPSTMIKNLIDNNNETRWGTGKAQTGGSAIEINLSEKEKITRVVIDHGEFIHDMPRSLRLSVYDLKTNELKVLFKSEGTRFYHDLRILELGDIPQVWDIRFEPSSTKRIRLEILESAPIFDWSIASLEIYKAQE